MAGMPHLLQTIRSLPKAELHVHLEGSVTPETLREIAPHLDPAEIQSRYQYENFLGFLKSYAWVTGFLERPEHYALVTRRLLEHLETQGVVHAELNLSVGVWLWRNQDAAAIFDAIEAAAASSPIPVRFIFDAVRQFGVEPARRVAELAAERTHRGVVALGIGGDEARGPAELFADVFRSAREAGLRAVPHAGETGGPDSVWQALALGASRIGHGIRSVEDPKLMAHLKDADIPLEICILSNVATGAVPNLAAHPVRALFDAGVPIVLNTDDPAMFHTNLLLEYRVAAEQFGFSESELKVLAANSLRYAIR